MDFTVKDMTCGGCAASIERAIARVDARAKVVVDLAGHRVHVETAAMTPAGIEAAIRAAGFNPVAITAGA